ncbi:unnamed protein product, partial [marine sediment metagenome]
IYTPVYHHEPGKGSRLSVVPGKVDFYPECGLNLLRG